MLEDGGGKVYFRKPGTTEVPLLDALCDFPEITYVLTLQESVAVGMADGYTRSGGDVGVVNVHTSVGTATQSVESTRPPLQIPCCSCHRQ